jgi:hypothetical protein
MKPLTIAIALIAAIAVSRAADLRAQIEASNKVITTAMKKKDFATLSKEMKAGTTSDFKYMEAGKTQSFDQMMQNMKAGLGMMNKLTVCQAKVLTLKQKGNGATTTTEHTMVGTLMGQDKKSHTMSFTGVSENTYVNQGGKWKMSSMNWKSMKQMMDGKPVPGMGGH